MINCRVKERIYAITRESLLDKGLSETEYTRQRHLKNQLKVALRNCKHGSISDKELVKEHIYQIISTYVGSEIGTVIPFDKTSDLSSQDMFDILLYIYKEKKSQGREALDWLISDHNLDGEKSDTDDENNKSFIIRDEDIKDIYFKHIDAVSSLDQRDKLRILTQRIYQQFKGLGVIDEIRDMTIDGVSGGVSGKISGGGKAQSIDESLGQIKSEPMHYDSVWIMYAGKSIHLSFLSFKSDKELRRVCQNIYSYNKAGQLSENVGYKINEMKDGSRVVVVRPTFSESWAFFVRKFNLSDKRLIDLVGDEKIRSILEYLVKGARIISITGAHGSGKTTLLMALTRSIYPSLPLRVQETAFELHLRDIYPYRNILSFRETDTILGQTGLDVQKKTDGAVNILGEVATDPVASWMIQMAQVASLFTIFTHHAKTASDLVLSLRNSMLRTKTFSNEKIAEEQVALVLNFDVHLKKDPDGKRYVSRITEIDAYESQAYPDEYLTAGKEDLNREFYKTQGEYFRRVTDRMTHTTKDILRWEKGSYVFCKKPSEKNLLEMKAHMTHDDREAFDDLISEVWS